MRIKRTVYQTLSKAFGYTINQKDGLMNFLKDGNIINSNNLAENSIRPFTVGRRTGCFQEAQKVLQLVLQSILL